MSNPIPLPSHILRTEDADVLKIHPEGGSLSIARIGPDKSQVNVRDPFLRDSVFLTFEIDYSALVMTLGGACTALKTSDACVALYPVGEAMRLTFQGDDWPFPAQWTFPRSAFNSAVLALL